MLSIVYASSAVRLFNRAELIELLEASHQGNQEHGITGMLLYRGGNFIQVIEGENVAVVQLYENIKAGPRHNNKRTLSGGLIAPGMNTLAAALKLTTSRLPEVEIETPGTAIQNTTVGSIQSGIVYGYFGLVKELLDRVKRESGDNAKVVATGGSAQFVADNTGQIDVVDKDLLLDGLYRLHTRLTAT